MSSENYGTNNNNVNEVDKKTLKEIEVKYSKKITKEDLKNVINEFSLKDLISSQMAEFEVKTQPLAKKFAKFAKKMNGKNPQEQKSKVVDFVKKNVYYFWEKYIEKQIPFLKDSNNILPEDVYYTYVFGFFVTLHSKKLKRQEKINVMANALAEIKINTENVKMAMQEYLEKTNNEKKN